MKIAFIFPGQASQYVGMGEEFYKNYKESKEVYDKANQLLGMDIASMCFKGPNEELLKTTNQQPAIHATEIAILNALLSHGVKPDMVAGFSLGEYAALVSANILSYEETIKLVLKRGELIQENAPLGVGKMAAILGLNSDLVTKLVSEVKGLGVVEVSNYNCPSNTVISGEVKAIDEAINLIKANKGKAIPLKVSAPFHTSLIKEAGMKLVNDLQQLTINKSEIPYLPNVTGKIYENGDIIELLSKQVYHPVLWEDTIKTMLDQGVDLFIEIGPGNSLVKNSKKTADFYQKQATFLNVDKLDDLNKVLEFIKERGK